MLREGDRPVVDALKPLLLALRLAVVSQLLDAVEERLTFFDVLGFAECRARGYGWRRFGREILLRGSRPGNREQ